MATKSLQRTIKALKLLGYERKQISERYISYGGKRGRKEDWFGIADLCVIRNRKLVAIQCCDGGTFKKHDKLIMGHKNTPFLLDAGIEVELWAWRKLKVKRGGKAMRWIPRIKEYTMEDFKND